jgi:hypothetical protein
MDTALLFVDYSLLGSDFSLEQSNRLLTLVVIIL